jgi:hypothetical protein
MGFGISASVPKVEVPKVPAVPAVPTVPDLAGAVKGAVGAVAGAAAGAAAGAKAAAGGALGAVAKVGASLAGVAGALAEATVSFEGPSVDVAMEPHMVLDANAGFGETKFEKGPIWIRVDLAPEKAKENHETLHLRSDDGAFDMEKKINEFQDETAETVDVLFEDAPMDRSYSLDVIDGKGVTHAMFAKIPYGDLRNTKNRF